VPSELHHNVTTTPAYSDKPSLSAKPTIEQPDPEPEPIQKPEPETEPETMAEPISEAESDTIEAPETPVLKEKETEIAVPPEQATELSNENPFTAESEISESENSVQKISEKITASLNPEPSPAMLADRFSTGNKSLSETMASSQAQGVAGSRLLFHPIADLLSGIGLNDKFSFISELFGNNPLHYEEAITRINKAVNVDEANWILQKYHTPEWDQKTDTLNRLKDFVKRRFI
jgi:hypothetical protein